MIYMKIKESLLLVTLAPVAGLFHAADAAPLVSIGDNVDVFFNGSSSVQWESNVFNDKDNEVDDLKWTVSPGLEMNVGRGLSNLDLSVITSYDIVRYDERSDQDGEYFHITGVGSYHGSRLDLNGTVGYDQNQSTSGEEGGSSRDSKIIESDVYRASLDGEYRLSPKFSVGSGISYSDQSYSNDDQLTDSESYNVPLDIFYELTPKVDLSVGYKYTMTKTGESESGDTSYGVFSDSYDKESHFFNVGARGDLLPKLKGYFKVGITTTDPDNSNVHVYDAGNLTTRRTSRDSSSTLGFDGNFTHLTTPKVTTTLSLNRGFDEGGEGQSTINTSSNLSASYSINTFFSASASFGFTLREYEDDVNDGDEETVYDAGVRLSYVPNQYWNFSTGYKYATNDSDRDGQGYDSHTIDLSVSLRY